MAKSRTALSALVLLVAASPTAAAGQAASAADAAARQQAQIRDAVAQSCPAGAGGNEVVVCGRREPVQRYRAPLPQAARPPERAGGEQLAHLDAGGGRCSAAVRDQQCNGGLSVVSVGGSGVGGIAGVLAEALAGPD